MCVCVSGSFSLGDRNVCKRQRLPIATVFIVTLWNIVQIHTHSVCFSYVFLHIFEVHIVSCVHLFGAKPPNSPSSVC